MPLFRILALAIMIAAFQSAALQAQSPDPLAMPDPEVRAWASRFFNERPAGLRPVPAWREMERGSFDELRRS